VFYTVYYSNDKRKEKMMDWTYSTNWSSEKLKKKSGKIKGQFHFKAFGG